MEDKIIYWDTPPIVILMRELQRRKHGKKKIKNKEKK